MTVIRKIFWFLIWILSIIVAIILIHKYNGEYDIGVNNGIAVLYVLMMWLPIVTFILFLTSYLTNKLTNKIGNWKILLIIIVQFISVVLIVDLYYWQHPSPIMEETTSVIWSKLSNK